MAKLTNAAKRSNIATDFIFFLKSMRRQDIIKINVRKAHRNKPALDPVSRVISAQMAKIA